MEPLNIISVINMDFNISIAGNMLRSNHATFNRSVLLLIIILVFTKCGTTQEVKIPSAKNEKYLYVAQRTIDSIHVHARDIYGEVNSGMILSILRCKDGKPIKESDLSETAGLLPVPPFGVREGDRTGLGGSNTNLQFDLYRAMEHLSRINKDPKYKAAANDALIDFLQITQHPETGLLAWGEHLYWDCFKDCLGEQFNTSKIHEPKRKFLYFDYLYSADPERTIKYALGLWDHQIADKNTGDFSRHARYDYHSPAKGADFPKEASYFIDIWARTYGKTKDIEFLRAITTIANRFLNRTNDLGLCDFDSSGKPDRINWCVTLPLLSMVIESENSLQYVDEETATVLKTLIGKLENGFLSLSHEIENPDKGFICYAYTDSGKPRPLERKKSNGYSRHWGMGYGIKTTSMYGLLAYSRQEQLEKGEKADAYRRMVIQAAKAYQSILPDPKNADIWAVEYGMAILLEIAAYRMSNDNSYLETAQKLADEAISVFWKDGQYAVPQASSLTNYYDCISGPDTLILALLALHEHTSGIQPLVEISDINR